MNNIRAAYEQDYARFGGKDDPIFLHRPPVQEATRDEKEVV